MLFYSNKAGRLLGAGNFSNNTSEAQEFLMSKLEILIFTSFYVTNMLLFIPLSAFVLFLGCKRWKSQRSNAKSTMKTSQSDIFTYHMVMMELIQVLGALFFCLGEYGDQPGLMKTGHNIFSCTWSVKVNFHSLTCVERYMAVVHPITYLGLKSKNGYRIRNISIGCVWFLCLPWFCVVALAPEQVHIILYFCLVAFTFAVVLFCSIAVLWVLKRPGPGDGSGDRKPADRMKLRAFYTILTITGALFLCFGGMLLCDALEASEVLNRDVGDAVLTSSIWFSLPSSLVLPLLFLHGAGTLPCCKYNKSG